MNDEKPGPGWTKGKDGRWYTHFFTYADFPGARTVAVVFKGLAIVVLVVGIVAAIETRNNLRSIGASTNEQTAVVAGVIAGTIIAASAMAFFGYVMQLLVAIHFDIRFADAHDDARAAEQATAA